MPLRAASSHGAEENQVARVGKAVAVENGAKRR